MKIRSIALMLAAGASLTACDGLREALTAHVDVVSRVDKTELSVTRLSDLLGNSTLQIPVNRETATIVADLWTGYQLLALAAAKGDSIIDPKLIDDATAGVSSNMRLRRYMQTVHQTLVKDSPSEATYTQATGGLFSARHILFSFPGGATQQQRDSVRRRAQSIRSQVTTGNFADMAKKHSGDPGSAARGGDLGTFPRSDMVKPFGDAVATLRPGEISGLVESQFGYHIILRPTYASAKGQYDADFNEMLGQRAESVYIAGVDAAAAVTVKASAPGTVKAAARDFAGHRSDTDVLATFNGGNLTLARLIRWIEIMPPQTRVAQQILQSSDSIVLQFVKTIARNEVLLKKADSAGIVASADEQKAMHAEFQGLLSMLWTQLGVDPRSLADSGKSAPERERIASARIEAFMDRVMNGQAQPLTVPGPAQSVLASMYKSKRAPAGLDRAVERATKLRASADSLRMAQQPPSQIPMPGAATPPPPDSKNSKRP